MSNIPSVTLHNGVTMPQIGLGVWQAKEGPEVEQAVLTALECGYRLIDTATIYHNEAGVGRAIKQSGVPREDIFLTTKVWNSDQGHDTTLAAFEKSLRMLDTEYLDLYLIHWPVPKQGKFIETWEAMEKLYADNRVRAIGVSNFKPQHLEELMGEAEIVPMVNQIELHPMLPQHETRDYCEIDDIQIESYSPLMQGGKLLRNEVITSLARKYEKTPAQIILRWHIEQDLVVIPKSITPERIESNIDIFNFELAEEDMTAVEALADDTRVGADPDHF
jgi:methylglyoxal/glyoxal reductase